MLVELTKNYAEEYIKPLAAELDRNNRFPEELLASMAQEGFFGIHYPIQYGGGGYDSVTAYKVMEELAKYSAGIALTFHVHWMACDALLKFGTEEQKTKYLLPMLKGEKVAAWSLSEPQAGSDVGGIITSALKNDLGWVLNGTKFFCTNGGIADIYFVACKTDTSLGAKGISMFIIEKEMLGFKIGPYGEKMGCRSSATTSLLIKECLVSQENILGSINEGFKVAMYGLIGGRLGMASMGLGIARAAFQEAVEYANKRQAFGKPIASQYAIQEMISEMYIGIEALDCLVTKAAEKRDKGIDYSLETSVAKLVAAKEVNQVCYKALQIFGGHGYMKYSAVERYSRDARLLNIGVGSTEVLKSVVGSTLLKRGNC